MLSDKEVVLQIVDMLRKWDIMLAGIKGDEVLIVIKNSQNRIYPSEIMIDGRVFHPKYYDSEEYFTLLRGDENIFRKYDIVYFVKVYMRKVLDLLASLEVERLSSEFNANNFQ